MTIVATPTTRGSATSHGHLLALIRDHQGLSRQQLMTVTGMSRGTLFERLETLARHDLVYEAETLAATGGRRSRKIRFNDRGRVVVAIDLGQTHARVAVLDMSGEERRAEQVRLRIDLESDAVLTPLLDLGDSLLSQGTGEVVVGIGVAIPSPVDVEKGLVSHPTTIPRWAPDAVLSAVHRRWEVPLVVENDARASAIGECRGDETLVYVKVATGIGCGIMSRGEVQRGAHGVAGDIGHILMDPNGPRCRCGRRGCLAAFSSGKSLLERLGGQGFETLDDLANAAQAGDPVVLAELDEAGDQLGRALAATVATVNPHRLVLGGVLGRLPHLVSQVASRVRRDLLDRVADRLVIEASPLGETAGTRGLTRIVVDRVYSPDAIDALVDGNDRGRTVGGDLRPHAVVALLG